jgi:hypothetical protein
MPTIRVVIAWAMLTISDWNLEPEVKRPDLNAIANVEVI